MIVKDARRAMAQDSRKLKDARIKLLLSSRVEMQKTIEKARSEFAAAQEELSRSRDREKRGEKPQLINGNNRRSRSRSPPPPVPTVKTSAEVQPVSGYQSFPMTEANPLGYHQVNNNSYAASIGEVRQIPLNNPGDPYQATFMGDRSVVDHQQFPNDNRAAVLMDGYGGRNVDSFANRPVPEGFGMPQSSIDPRTNSRAPLLDSHKLAGGFVNEPQHQTAEYLANFGHDGANVCPPSLMSTNPQMQPGVMQDRRGFDPQMTGSFNQAGYNGGMKQPLMGYGGIPADPPSFPPAIQPQMSGRQRRPLLDSVPMAKLPEPPIPPQMSSSCFPRGYPGGEEMSRPYQHFNEPLLPGPFPDRFGGQRPFEHRPIDGQFARSPSEMTGEFGNRFPPQHNPFEDPRGNFQPQDFDQGQFMDGVGGGMMNGVNPRLEPNFPPTRMSPSYRRDMFVRVTNIPQDYRSYSALREFFHPLNLAGFDRIKILCNERRERIGTAYLQFNSPEDCEEALRRDGRLSIQIDRCSEAEFVGAVDGGLIPTISAGRVSNGSAGRNTPPERQVPRRNSRENSQSRSRREDAASPDSAVVLLLENVAYVTREFEIGDMMRKSGANMITIATEFRKENAKLRTGNLFVELASEADLPMALKCDQQLINGRPVRISRSSAREMYSRTGVRTKGQRPSTKPTRNGPSPSGQQPNERRIPIEASRPSSTCVFVSNMPYSANDRDVYQFFGGLRIANVKFMPETRGTAYVEFQNGKDAEMAVGYSRKQMGSRSISVEMRSKEEMLEASRREVNKPGLLGGGGKPPLPYSNEIVGGNREETDLSQRGCLLALHNLPLDVTLEDLQGFFNGYELVKDTVMMHYDNNGTPTGDCLVTIASVESARRAVEKLDGKLLNGKAVVIYPAS